MGTHYGWRGHPALPNGKLGVDAFFVLSGFLITTLLLVEWDRNGRISLRKFYARRALRLLPLLAVVLIIAVVINLTTHQHNTPGRPDMGHILGTAFYYDNWWHFVRPSYPGFLTPAWSLAIEEQFYLIWPIMLIGFLSLGLRKRGLLIVVLVGAAASAIWRHHMVTAAGTPTFVDFYRLMTAGRRVDRGWTTAAVRADHAYFRTDTRADMLLVGCAVAIALLWLGPRITPFMRRFINAAAIVAAGVVLLFMLNVIADEGHMLLRWGGVVFEICVAAVIVAVATSRHTGVSKVLAITPLVWIGRRSYGIYLVHVFVFKFLGRNVINLGEWGSLVFAFACVFIIAGLSYRYIEEPALRLKDRFSATGAPDSPFTHQPEPALRSS
jgi:peptidoglycan/LPS O-acetylase OafA/YrhL